MVENVNASSVISQTSYLKENFKLHLLIDVCTLYAGALVSVIYVTILNLEKRKRKIELQKEG